MKVKELYHRCKPSKIPCGTRDLPVPETGCGIKPATTKCGGKQRPESTHAVYYEKDIVRGRGHQNRLSNAVVKQVATVLAREPWHQARLYFPQSCSYCKRL